MELSKFSSPIFPITTYMKMQYLLLFFIGGRKSNSPFQIILVKITAQKLKLKLEALFRFIPKFLECKPIKSESRVMFQKSTRLLRVIHFPGKKQCMKKSRIGLHPTVKARIMLMTDLKNCVMRGS